MAMAASVLARMLNIDRVFFKVQAKREQLIDETPVKRESAL